MPALPEIFSKNGISLERLGNFCRVAECGSIKKAVGDDPNRQSLYSRQIRELESFFGVQLFDRVGRTLRLTVAGEKLSALVSEYTNALEDFHEWCDDADTEVSIGTGDALIQWHLIPRLEQICEFFKCKRVSFQNLKTSQIIDRVRKGLLHYGIVRRESCPTDFQSMSIGTIIYSVFVPSKVKVKRGVGLAELLSENQLVGMEGEGTYSTQMQSLGQCLGSFNSYKVLCASFPEMAKVLKHHKLVGVMPEIAKQDLKSDAFKAHRFKELKSLDTEMVLFWNSRFNTQVLRGSLCKSALNDIFNINTKISLAV